MSEGFKVIAIIPLKGCSSDYRKNLKEGGKYQFYKNYDIKISTDNKKILSVEETDNNVPKDLYNLKNGININVSAVVGQNGSGKSTLFEMLYYFIYLLSTDTKFKLFKHLSKDKLYESSKIDEDLDRIVNNSQMQLSGKKLPEDFQDYENISELNNSLIEKYNIQIPCNSKSFLEICNEIKNKENNITISKCLNKVKETLKEESKLIIKKLREIQDEVNNQAEKEVKTEAKLKKGFACAIIFVKDKDIFELKYFKEKFELINHTNNNKIEKITKSTLKEFFYTISLNYSHHSLNSDTIGNWITKLFHKNDAYVTPVVINPMRINGNIDINKEMYLSKSRLFSNVIYDIIKNKETIILGKYNIKSFVFTVKKNINPVSIEWGKSDFFTTNIVGRLIKQEIGITSFEDNTPFLDFSLDYLLNKINKIRINYGFLIEDKKNKHRGKDILSITEDNSFISDNDILNYIKGERTHITKKIRQTLNFIKYSIELKDKETWSDKETIITVKIPTDEMITWIKKCEPNNYKTLKPNDIIEYALPSFFDIDFNFVEVGKGDIISSDKFSSGEQQMIFNINSILYHLYNLQSIHNDPDRIAYSDINITLDEIELYYHPDMQRKLVKTILEALENIEYKEDGIKNINICFLTHSPFILSDILNENILQIDENGMPLKYVKNSFGANIHNLLADSFFMGNGFMGDLAKDKINQTVSLITEKIKLNDMITEIDDGKKKIELLKKINNLKNKQDDIENTINIIGEPLIKIKLQEMYKFAFSQKKD